MRRARRWTAWAFAWLTAIVLVGGVPLTLAKVAGWPFPRSIPTWDRISTAVRQGDIPTEVVIKTLAVFVWLAWIQLMWAFVWELIVNVPRITRGRTSRPTPLVFTSVSSGIGRFVAVLLSIGIVVTTSRPATALAPTAAPSHIRPIVPMSVVQTADPADSASPSMDRWHVRSADSLWSIAERSLGDGARVDEILDLNPTLASARDLRVGHVLALPAGAIIPEENQNMLGEATPDTPAAESAATIDIAPAYLPESTVTIVPDDTLWDIADDRVEAAMLRDATGNETFGYVNQIVAANPTVIENPNLIFPGEQFLLPSIGTPPVEATWQPPTAPPVDQPGTPPAEAESVPSPAPVVPELIQPAAPAELPPPTTVDVPMAESPTATRQNPMFEPESQATATVEGSEAPGWPWLAGVSGATVLASGVLVTVRRRRTRQAATGQHAHRSWFGSETRSTELAVVAAADIPLIRWAGQELSALVYSLKPKHVNGSPLAIEISESDGLELLWDTQNPSAPHPWEATDGGWAWRLPYDPDIEVPAPELPAAIPGLVTIGTRDGKQLLLNLEAVGSLAITGDTEHATDLIRSIVLELASGEDLSDVYIHTVGINTVTFDHMPRIIERSASDAVGQVRDVVADHQRILAEAQLESTFQLRAGHAPAGRELTLVIIDSTHDSAAEIVASTRPHLGVAAILLGDHPEVSARIEIYGHDTATLQPVGISFAPAGLPDTSSADIVSLLDQPNSAKAPGQEPEAVAAPEAISDQSASHGDDEPASTSAFPEEEELTRGKDADDDDWTIPEPEILVRVLGVPSVPAFPKLGRLELNLVTFIACHGGNVTEDQVIDAVWNGRFVERTNLWNRVSKARATMGRYLPAREQGSPYIRLDPAVVTDLDVFTQIAKRAAEASSTQASDLIDRAMSMVNGAPFDAPGFDWAHLGQYHAQACDIIESTALTGIDLALDSDDIGRARTFAASALRALPGNEAVYRARMRTEAHAGNTAGIRNAYAELQAALAELSSEDAYEPSVPTNRLLHDLTKSPSRGYGNN